MGSLPDMEFVDPTGCNDLLEGMNKTIEETSQILRKHEIKSRELRSDLTALKRQVNDRQVKKSREFLKQRYSSKESEKLETDSCPSVSLSNDTKPSEPSTGEFKSMKSLVYSIEKQEHELGDRIRKNSSVLEKSPKRKRLIRLQQMHRDSECEKASDFSTSIPEPVDKQETTKLGDIFSSIAEPASIIDEMEATPVCFGDCTRQKSVTSVNDLKEGDHIVFQRPGYQHHALVVKLEKIDDFVVHITVIHKTGNGVDVLTGIISYIVTLGQYSPKGRLVEETFRVDFRQFTDFEKISVVNYKTKRFSAEKIISRARAELEKEKSTNYNLANNNCEHVITWCVTGEWYSDQIDTLCVKATNVFSPFSTDTPSLQKLEEMKKHDLICNECYTKCKKRT